MKGSRLYLIRHGKAGSRERWSGPDEERPLTAKGERQAEAIAGALKGCLDTASAILSSPAVRCRDTVVPLAKRLGLPVEDADWLFEGGDPAVALGHLGRLAGALGSPPTTPSRGRAIAACTHGDIVWGVLDYLSRAGVVLGPQPDAPKGGIWVLDYEGPEVAKATFMLPSDGE